MVLSNLASGKGPPWGDKKKGGVHELTCCFTLNSKHHYIKNTNLRQSNCHRLVLGIMVGYTFDSSYILGICGSNIAGGLRAVEVRTGYQYLEPLWWFLVILIYLGRSPTAEHWVLHEKWESDCFTHQPWRWLLYVFSLRFNFQNMNSS